MGERLYDRVEAVLQEFCNTQCSIFERAAVENDRGTVRSRYKRIVYKRIWVASLPFQSVWATFCSY